MVIKVGINGFGRVGRVVFRTCLKHPDVEVSAINDPAVEVDYICYLIKFDSTHGTLKSNVTCTENEIIIDDVSVKVFRQKLPNSIPWQSAGVEYVIEASGMFTNLEKASGHLECPGVKRVIVTAPSVDIPMVVLGVNDIKIKPENKVISCGSSTLYCLAPIVKILEDNYGVEEGFITSIHAMTPSLKPLDGLCLKGKHWRDHRSITQNIIPAVTGACKALGRVLPSVRDKLCGLAFRVPIVNVSVLDLTVRLKKYTSIENIARDVNKFSKTLKETIITTSTDEAVSSDFVGNSHSCVLDVGSSLQLKPNAFKLICWYENEYSYACRVVDLILFSEVQLTQKEECVIYVITSKPKEIEPEVCKLYVSTNKTTFVRPKTSKKHDTIVQTDCNIQETDSNKDTSEVKLEHSNKGPNMASEPNLKPNTLQKTSSNNLKPVDSELLGKSIVPLSITARSPTSSFTRDKNKRIELFKIWNCVNDNTKTNIVRQNMSSFFQIYTKASPKSSKNGCPQTRERLERVKREFSKMIGITEDIHEKDDNSELKTSSLDSSNHKVLNTDKSICKFKTESKIETNKTCIQFLRFNNSNYSANLSKQNLDNSDKGDIEKNTLHEKDSSDNYIINGDGTNTMSDIQSSLASVSDDKKNILDVKDMKSEKQQIIDNNKRFISKTFTNIFDGFSKNIQKSIYLASDNVSNPIINEQPMIEQTLESKYLDEPNEIEFGSYESQTSQSTNDVIISKPTPILMDNTYKTISFHEGPDFIKYPDDLIKKQEQNNDHSTNMDINKNYGDMNIYAIAEINNEQNENAPNRENSYTSLVESTYALAADDASKCSETRYKNKQDIYDKLDSDSATDSDSGKFNIDGRKSQVLNISDLTNSLDDLDRLDKICKIMEISDELSDKLFSPLDRNYDANNVSKKKWSFKDLCEKINFDEFCGKVFGK